MVSFLTLKSSTHLSRVFGEKATNTHLKVRSLRIRTKSLDLAPANNESYIPWKEIVAVTFDTKNIMPIDPVFRVLSEKQG